MADRPVITAKRRQTTQGGGGYSTAAADTATDNKHAEAAGGGMWNWTSDSKTTIGRSAIDPPLMTAPSFSVYRNPTPILSPVKNEAEEANHKKLLRTVAADDKEAEELRNTARIQTRKSGKPKAEESDIVDQLSECMDNLKLEQHQSGMVHAFYNHDYADSLAPVQEFLTNANRKLSLIEMIKVPLNDVIRFIAPLYVPVEHEGSRSVKARMTHVVQKKIRRMFELGVYRCDKSIITLSDRKIGTCETVCIQFHVFKGLFPLRAGFKWEDIFSNPKMAISKYLFTAQNNDTRQLEMFVSCHCFTIGAAAVYDWTKLCGSLTSVAGAKAYDTLFETISVITKCMSFVTHQCLLADFDNIHKMAIASAGGGIPSLESEDHSAAAEAKAQAALFEKKKAAEMAERAVRAEARALKAENENAMLKRDVLSLAESADHLAHNPNSCKSLVEVMTKLFPKTNRSFMEAAEWIKIQRKQKQQNNASASATATATTTIAAPSAYPSPLSTTVKADPGSQ